MKRPSPYVPLSVTFATGRTGTAIIQKYGLEGLGVWVSLIAAAKSGEGQVVFRHEDDWAAIGLSIHPPSFPLKDFLAYLGRRKQTRTTAHGRVMYVQLTRWADWNHAKKREDDRLRKSRKRSESTPDSEPDAERTPSGQKSDLEVEVEGEVEELPGRGSPTSLDSRNGTPDSENDFERELALQDLLRTVTDKDERSADTLRHYAFQLPVGAIVKVRESSKGKPARYACAALKSELEERKT